MLRSLNYCALVQHDIFKGKKREKQLSIWPFCKRGSGMGGGGGIFCLGGEGGGGGMLKGP